MLFLGDAKLPDGLLPQPETRSLWERRAEIKESYSAYVKASDNLQTYRDNVNSHVTAMQDAYEARIAAIKDATGVTLENPLRGPIESRTQGRAEFMRGRKDKFTTALQELAAKHPDKSDAIRAGVPIERDAEAITRGKVGEMQAAERQAENLPFGLRFFGGLEGSIKGMLRDPATYLTLMAGGPEITAAKSLGGRIMSRALTEAAVNGAVEIPLQAAAENWRAQAGVPLGWKGSLQQVGLAAAFGGGFGGLLQGGSEVLRALKKATPETDAAIARMREGTATVEDVQLIVEAAGSKIDEPDMTALSRAIEEDADDALVLADGAAGREVGEVVAAIENDLPVPAGDRITSAAFENDVIAALTKDSEVFADPLQWADIASKDPEAAGALLDDVLARVRDTEKALAKKYNVKPADLEDAPLTAEEIDFLFHSNVPDAESARELRRIIEPVASHDEAAQEMSYALKGIQSAGAVSDAEKTAMARLNFLHGEVSRLGGDPMATLKEAVERFATRVDDPEDQIFLAQSVMARISEGMNSRVAAAADVPPGAGVALIDPAIAGGKLGEPATAEAGESAAAAYAAAGGEAAAKSAEPPAGGLFDDEARAQLDIMDALPAGTDAAGKPMLTTHAELAAQADRVDHLADVISSCRG